jgi:hypothetical protein
LNITKFNSCHSFFISHWKVKLHKPHDNMSTNGYIFLKIVHGNCTKKYKKYVKWNTLTEYQNFHFICIVIFLEAC